jgi:hypothetical protein
MKRVLGRILDEQLHPDAVAGDVAVFGRVERWGGGVSQGQDDGQPGKAPGAFSNRFLTEAADLEYTILLL